MTYIPNTFSRRDEQIVSGAAVTTVTFNNLNINLDKFYMMLGTITNPSVGVSTYHIFFNNDTVLNNYDTIREQVAGAPGGLRVANDTQMMILDPGESGIFYLYAMEDPGGDVRANSLVTRRPAANIDEWWFGVLYDPGAAVANVTRIDITGSVASSIGIGSMIELLRVNPQQIGY